MPTSEQFIRELKNNVKKKSPSSQVPLHISLLKLLKSDSVL